MEVQDNPDTDEVGEKAPSPVTAKTGKSYPIRVLHLINGMLIIGFIIEVFPETTMVLRPYVVEAEYDPVKMNVTEYEFTPYMDQMVHYDPLDLSPIPFMNSTTISICRPAQHLIDNYVSVIQLKEAVKVSENKAELQIYRRSYVNPKTKH